LVRTEVWLRKYQQWPEVTGSFFAMAYRLYSLFIIARFLASGSLTRKPLVTWLRYANLFG